MKRLLALIVVVLIFGSLSCSARELFDDVPESDWAAPYIYNLVDRGIVSGYGDGTFGPTNNVQRCEYAKMLVNIAGININSSATSPYRDVPTDQWFFPYINSALSLITGYTIDGELYFKPEEVATREDVTVAMVKALGIDISKYSNYNEYLSAKFADWNDISLHNRAYVTAAVDKGIITGDMAYNGMATFRPKDSIIRAEVVAVLYRAFPDNKNVEANHDWK